MASWKPGNRLWAGQDQDASPARWRGGGRYWDISTEHVAVRCPRGALRREATEGKGERPLWQVTEWPRRPRDARRDRAALCA